MCHTWFYAFIAFERDWSGEKSEKMKVEKEKLEEDEDKNEVLKLSVSNKNRRIKLVLLLQDYKIILLFVLDICAIMHVFCGIFMNPVSSSMNY